MPILFSNVRIARPMDPGHGGQPFHCHAGYPGFALVGLAVRSGAWIDQVTPIFAEMLEHGTLGAEFYGASFGGGGGSRRELRAAPGHVITGMQTRSGSFVDGIRLLQTPWDGELATSGSSWSAWQVGDLGGGSERPDIVAEPAGHAVAIGITGRAGAYLDTLGLITADLTRFVGGSAHVATARGSSKTAQALG